MVTDEINPTRVRLLHACGVVGFVGALLLVADRVTAATASVGGFWGSMLDHLDVGRMLVVMSVSAALWLHWLDPSRSAEGRSILTRRWVRSAPVAIYTVWFAAAAAAIAALHPATSGRQLFTTLALFRPVGSGSIVPGLGFGPLVLELAVIAATVTAGLRWRAALITAHAMRIAAALIGLGVVARVIGLASSGRHPLSFFATLPADLDLVGFALAGVVWLTSVDQRTVVRRLTSRPARFGGAALGAAVVAYVLLAVAVDQPLDPTAQSSGASLLQSLLGVGIAALVMLAVLLLAPLRPHRPTLVVWLVMIAVGWAAFHETAFVLFARQQAERYVPTVFGPQLDGPALPILLWTLIASGAIGIIVGAVVLQLFARPLRLRALPHWFTLDATALVAVAFVWRVFALVTIAPDRVDGGDPLFYHTTANALAAGQGFIEPLNWIAYGDHLPTALHGPLFSMVLSLPSRIGGTTYFDHRMMATLCGTAVVLGVILVGRQVGGRAVALVAAAIAAFYPNLWLIDGVLFPEGLMAALVMFSIWCAYRWADRPSYRIAAILGVLIGLTALTRGEGVLLMVILVPPLMLRKRSLVFRDRTKHVLVAGLGCAVILGPWMVRNLASFEEFVPLSTNGNELLVYANCDDTYNGKFLGFWVFDCQERIRQEFGDPPGDASQTSAFWGEIGVDYISDHKSELPKVVLARVGRQWDLFRPLQNVEFAPIEGRDRDGALIGLISFYGLAALSINGVRVLRRRKVSLLPLGTQFLSVTLTAAYAYGTVRFRAPVEPVLCLLAAVGVTPLLRKAWMHRSVQREAPIVDPAAFVLGGSVRRGWSWPTAAGVAITSAVTLLPVRGMFKSTGGTMEEGFMLAFPERILKGDVPNVDFLHLYGPGALDVLAGWYSLFGVTLNSERAFGLVQNVAIIAALYVIARAWGRAAAAVTATLSVFLVMTPIGLTAMAWNGGVALGLWSVIFAIRARNLDPDRVRSRRIAVFVAGLLAGLALTYRPDLGVALLIAHGWLFWRRRDWRRAIVGLGVGLLPLIIHVIRIGPRTAIDTMILDPVLKLRPGRELPRPPSWNVLDGALQAIAETAPPWWRLPAIAPSHQLFLWFFALPVLAIAVVLVGIKVRRSTDGPARSLVLIGAGLFGVGLLPQAFQRPDSTHLTWVACVTFPLLIPTMIELIRMWRPLTHPRLRVGVAGLALAGLLFAITPYFTYRTYLLYSRVSVGDLPPAFEVERNGRTFFMGDARPWRATRDVITRLDELSTPGETLFVGPVDLRRTWYSDTFFYYLFPELPPATQFMEMDPGIADAEGSPMADEIAEADWLILTAFWAGWREPNSAMNFGPDEPNQVVRDQFCLVDSFEDDLVLLYRRCQP